MRRTVSGKYRFLATAVSVSVLWQVPAHAAEPRSANSPEAVRELLDKELVGIPGKELLMLTVEYLPGGASLPHRHDAQVFVYVLQGELTMQVEGSPAVTVRQGETFYESPSDVHLTSANASRTAPAKILVFIVKDKGAAVSRKVPQKAT